MSKTLQDYATLINDTIQSNEINHYITTDNMCQNLGGIDTLKNINIPQGKVRSFQKDDVLLSNIRLYFRKVYRAKQKGGCSSDVLVFRAKHIDSATLFAILSSQIFTDYACSGSQGSKMPRGNKTHMMDFKIPTINFTIAKIFNSIQNKIENNHKINELLHTLAYKVYEYYFKYKPKNAKLEQIIIENPKSSIMVKNAQKTQDKYPFFTSGDNILSYPKAIIDGRNCFLNTGGNAGIKFYVGKASYSTDTWCICANEFSDYLYLLLSSIKTHINQSFFQGTSLKHLQKNLLKKYPIYMPSVHEIKKFNQIIMPLLTLISINTRTSKKLEQIRDFLLPLLLKQQVKPQ
ncbi:restriction endonuclease subunit S [Helicobacter pylori]|uniref:Restriction endonuclease subunit S n=1 Tax=Helicobacter pylori TaxID=210 RepID=A0AAE7TSB3_HELPX|nr:restriction endonuclease subunit S [Helicobacter pylori]AFI00711.1 type I restriction enzyme S protein [Helicobacter pylori Shi112]QQW91986.1 restriction endonuclease subunit S [Helicobacter pylori]QQW93420.1 restriction endonuclease subunit S [Helicobacter pylori]QQX50790.1 restriction endonuclease subunit S [Helicobacter pylori]